MIGRGILKPTVEDVLSHIRTLKSLCGKDEIDGFSERPSRQARPRYLREVRKSLARPLPKAIRRIMCSRVGFKQFRATSRWKSSPRTTICYWNRHWKSNVFRTLTVLSVPTARSSTLNRWRKTICHARWARLWKIHGSINWWMTAKKKIRRSRDASRWASNCLIYPSHLKYDQSRQMPYFAMLDRLRVFLRSDQCVLLTCGYSFGDEHINAVHRTGAFRKSQCRMFRDDLQ